MASNPNPSGSVAPGFEVVRDGPPPTEIPADGVMSVMVRRGVAKVELYQFVGLDQATRREQRRISHRISMPVSGLEELALILRRMSDLAKQQQGKPPQPQGTGEPIRLVD